MKTLALTIALLPALAAAAPEKRPAKPPVPPAAPAASSAPDLDAAIRLRIEVFFKMLKENRVDGAYAKLFEGGSLAVANPAAVSMLASNTEQMLEKKCGKLESATLLRVRSAGPTLKEITYIANGQLQPVRWLFYAYRVEGRWQILNTDTDLELGSFFDTDKPEKDR